MGALDVLQTVGSLAALLVAGWLFLRSTILQNYDASHRRNLVVQLLFAAVFALSANLLQLLICEILGMMEPGSVREEWGYGTGKQRRGGWKGGMVTGRVGFGVGCAGRLSGGSAGQL